MNIFNYYQKNILNILSKSKEKILLKNIEKISVESPPEKFDCDLSTNIPMILAKHNKTTPEKIALIIKKILEKEILDFKSIEIAKPGFLNITLSQEALNNFINQIFLKPKNFGSNNFKRKYNIEFVSANPTGPMHIGHLRGAIFGDVLSNLLKFNGSSVLKEFYINDYGNQIENFAKSVFYRIREIKKKEKYPDDKNLYPGIYIKEIAEKIIKENPKLDLLDYEKNYSVIKKNSVEASMRIIKDDLKKLGVSHDVFTSETEILNKTDLKKLFLKLQNEKLIVEGYLEPPKGEEYNRLKKTKKLIFKTTLFGDDMDRALQKNDGSWTYFANDIAYHSDKISRGFDELVNILGADHTGYIKRISAAVEALSKGEIIFKCKVCQLVKLFKEGKPYKMSKRAGEFISANDLLSEVGKDAVRFMMLNRSNDVELDFDFNKVIEKTKDNPVFYVQYCFARINSLFRTIDKNINEQINKQNFSEELNIYEKKLLRKIFEWPRIIENSCRKFEPHRIPFYLYDLATLFHSYWSKGNDDDKYKFISEGNIRNENTFIIINLISIVLQNGMKILNVSLPNKM